VSRFERRTIVTGESALVVARKLPLVLRSALEEMLGRSESLKPFLVLSDVRTEKFVQWCGGDTRPLRFEAPAISLVMDPAGDVGLCITLAIETLMIDPLYRVGFEDGALMLESDTYEAAVSAVYRERDSRR